MKTKITILMLLCLAGLTMKAQVPQFIGTGGGGIYGGIDKINADGSNLQCLYVMPKRPVEYR